MEDGHAAQIFCEGIGSGSGHLVRPDIILTARHVLCRPDNSLPPRGTVYEYRLWADLQSDDTDEDWHHAQVLWDDRQLDVALLRIVRRDASPALRQVQDIGRSPLFGRLPLSDASLECLAIGWPKVLKTRDHWQAFPIRARISSRWQDRGLPIQVDVDNGPRDDEGWQGYSGAAVRVGEMLIGIVTQADPRFLKPTLQVRLLADIPSAAAFWDHVNRPQLIDVGVPPVPPKPPVGRRVVAIFAETDRKAAIMSHRPAISWIAETRLPKGAPPIERETSEVLLDRGRRLQAADLVVVFGKGAPEGLILRTGGTTTTLAWRHLARRIGDIAPDVKAVFLCVPDSAAASQMPADGVPLISVGSCADEALLRAFTIRLLETFLRESDVREAYRSARATAEQVAGHDVPFLLSPGGSGGM